MGNFVRLPLKNAYNARDLGGYPTSNGLITNYRQFIRSDGLEALDEADINILLDYGLKAVIDLRGPAELTEAPNPFASNGLVNYLNVPLKPGNQGALHVTERYKNIDKNYLRDAYLEILEQSGPKIKEIFEFIAEQDGAVLFHCSAGKDRTGVLAMLLLGLVGVGRADIITNYMMTEIYIQDNPRMRSLPERVPYHIPEELLQSKPEFLIPSIDLIEKEYQTVGNYLLSVGLTSDVLTAITNNFTSRLKTIKMV